MYLDFYFMKFSSINAISMTIVVFKKNAIRFSNASYPQECFCSLAIPDPQPRSALACHSRQKHAGMKG
jgi:hypothetical protein